MEWGDSLEVRSLEIRRIRGGIGESRQDLVTEEISLKLLAEHRRIAVLMCSPGDLEDLVRGFFYTNGFIQNAGQIHRIVVNRATWSAFVQLAPEIDPGGFRLSGVIGSACGATLPVEADGKTLEEGIERQRGVRTIADGLRVRPEQISAFMEDLRDRSQLHRQTGGVHAAALAGPGGVLIFREDIGRHNAVDKVIGAALLQELGFEDKLLLTSGRLSSEILHKASACALPIVVSRSAPTDRCVAAARERNITLIGFARGSRMNVYSAGQRIEGKGTAA
jgi:FdhD protein